MYIYDCCGFITMAALCYQGHQCFCSCCSYVNVPEILHLPDLSFLLLKLMDVLFILLMNS